MSIVAYISTSCPSCLRLVEIVRSSGKAAADISLVDVATIPSSELARLQVVPTLQFRSGRVLTGAKAFEFLQEKYQNDTMEHYDFGMGHGLVYSDVGQSGLKRTLPYEKF